MRPPRVLQLISNAEIGGVKTLAETVATGLAGRGCEVQTLSLDGGAGPPGRLVHLARVAGQIVSARPDVILGYQPAAALFGAVFGALAGSRVRATHQTAIPEAIRPVWRLWDRLAGVTGVYTHVISNSRATSSAFAGYPRRYRMRMIEIAHGVAPLPPPSRRRDWRGERGIAADALVLVATGRLAEQKNHRLAVAALARLPQAHLVIAGDGPEQRALLLLARRLGVAQRLHLVGALPREELAGLLAAADIYLFPSRWETFGLAGVEAAMAGLPIVAADLPVLREVLGDLDPELVRFHAPEDAAALAREVAALAAALPDGARRLQLATAAHRRHGVDAMVDRYMALIAAARPVADGSRETIGEDSAA
jgi:glycosyltransferase involved in cell wall biosynthesis